jgi:5'-nucleotidase
MKVLLTNDDGILAPGLAALRRIFEKVYDVMIVAPDRECSAIGHGITVHQPIRAETVKFSDSSITGLAVNGTPSDSVKLAFEISDVKPDIVVSGVNRGYNLGTDVLYSGTVSAAIEGVINGVPAIAVSVAISPDKQDDYNVAAEFALKITRIVLEKGLAPETLLNINVPLVSRQELTGVQITNLGKRRYENVFDKRSDPRGRTYYWLAGEPVDIDDGPNSDFTAIKNKKISVTPVHLDLTRYDIINTLRAWNLTID